MLGWVTIDETIINCIHDSAFDLVMKVHCGNTFVFNCIIV
ncbi:hypothetical protein HMPREF9022_01313 [Erysipelotrichaceae bacterium 2_2_44A]|nr:hypothetical protein HMPREF9022_01313 [Erysipelotrichaceae bacterium 2_2_44A]